MFSVCSTEIALPLHELWTEGEPERFIKRPVDSVYGVFAKFSLAKNLKTFNKKRIQHVVGQISITNVAWSHQQPRQQVPV